VHLINEMDYYHNTDNPISFPLIPEHINYWDLTCVLSGHLHYFVDGTNYHLYENDIILLPPGCCRERFHLPEPAAYISYNFFVHPGVELDLPRYNSQALTPKLRQTVSLYENEFLGSDPYAVNQVILIADFILYELLSKKISASYNPHVSCMLDIINKRIYEPLSLSDVAAAAHISLSYAANLFKKDTGCTVAEYIRKQKMLLARDLILSGSMSLTEIAETIGYTHYSYFSLHFHVQFGCSASNIRNYYKNRKP